MNRATGELAMVLFNAAAFGVCDGVFHAKAPAIVATGLIWLGYIVVRCRREPGIGRKWGFGTTGLWPAAGASAAAVLAGSAGMLCYGLLRGHVTVPASFWVLGVLYLPWGLMQQFLVNAMFAANLMEVLAERGVGVRTRAPITVAVTALLFGLVHLPDPVLTPLCCCAGLVWAAIYLRWRNLWPLGVSHVLLGAMAYYVVVRRDPLAEISMAIHGLMK